MADTEATNDRRAPLVAVDIGNSRLKCGLFEPGGTDDAVPQPVRTKNVGEGDFDLLHEWLAPHTAAQLPWYIGSVRREATTRLLDWLRETADVTARLICSADLPLQVHLPLPDRVGIDRLLAAAAASGLRKPGREAIVVDLGTAITVDRLDAAGAFCGGAILPGIGMSARAFHEFTDLLPLLELSGLEDPPDPCGTDTLAAMQAGLFWGAVGGIREMIARLSAQPEPCVFVTGGAAPAVARLLSPQAEHVPHLILSGIALAARNVP